MRQLLVKLSEEDYRVLEEYCRKTGRTKSAVIRREMAKAEHFVALDQKLIRAAKKMGMDSYNPESGPFFY